MPHPTPTAARARPSVAPRHPTIVVRLPQPLHSADAADRLLGRVRHLIRVEAGRQDAAMFVRRAFACRSYDDLVALIRDTVTVLP